MTREPYEMFEDQHWEILDPNEAKLIAIFFDEHQAQCYLDFINQELAGKKKNKKLSPLLTPPVVPPPPYDPYAHVLDQLRDRVLRPLRELRDRK